MIVMMLPAAAVCFSHGSNGPPASPYSQSTDPNWVSVPVMGQLDSDVNNTKFLGPIAQFAITINSNVCPHIRVQKMLMRESYA